MEISASTPLNLFAYYILPPYNTSLKENQSWNSSAFLIIFGAYKSIIIYNIYIHQHLTL